MTNQALDERGKSVSSSVNWWSNDNQSTEGNPSYVMRTEGQLGTDNELSASYLISPKRFSNCLSRLTSQPTQSFKFVLCGLRHDVMQYDAHLNCNSLEQRARGWYIDLTHGRSCHKMYDILLIETNVTTKYISKTYRACCLTLVDVHGQQQRFSTNVHFTAFVRK